MDSIKQALYEYLRDYPIAGGNVYPSILPEAPAYPAVTYQQVGVTRQKNYCGTHPHVRTSFQLDAWGLTPTEAENCATQVRLALIDQRGQWGGSPGVWVDDVRIENEFDLHDLEPGLYRVSMDVTIWHLE